MQLDPLLSPDADPAIAARLKAYQLWPRVIGESILDRAIADVTLSLEEEAAHWQTSRAAARPDGLSENERRAAAVRRLRVEKFKAATWTNALPAHFLHRKPTLDRAVYSLLRVRDPGEAAELHRRLAAGEAAFAELAAHSAGPEADTGGLLGPTALGAVHPSLAGLLAAATPGELRPPERLGEWMVILRLEKRLPARFDDPAVRAQLLQELFDAWLSAQTAAALSRPNGIPAAALALPEPVAAADAPALPEEETVVPKPVVARSKTNPPEAPPFPVPSASGELDAALVCFELACRQFGLPHRPDSIRRVLANALERTPKLSLPTLGAVAELAGLHAQLVMLPARALALAEPPALLRWHGKLALLYAAGSGGAFLACPETGWQALPPADSADPADAATPGLELLLLRPASVETPDEAFSLHWFWPAVWKYRRPLGEVLAASLFVQLFTLANPLLTQVIIDKVLVQNSGGTLHVLGLLLAGTAFFGAALSGLRTYLFVDTTNRIDLSLGAAVIDRLYRLPLPYFQRRPVGELATRLNELENIRQFLTGTALTVVLDAVFSLLYLAVMLAYSVPLTAAALGAVPLLGALSLGVAPLLRRQLRARAERYAATQSFLVETLGGISTVKAQSLEGLARWRWQERYGKFVSAGFRTVLTSTGISTASGFLSRLADLAVLWFGASLVLQQRLSVGQLIAFRIIAGYVSAPLLRLAGSWQQFQEVGLSIERLGDILDAPREGGRRGEEQIPLPPVAGAVAFENVTFSYVKNDAAPTLRTVSFAAAAGAFVGVVGQSGSGKSTLLKLLPRLYVPDAGRVFIDGYDAAKVELGSLRRQIGVVLQDSLLFDGTVRENIALGLPDAPAEEIIAAARVAAAHEFIMGLPDGYNTRVGEGGRALSGGQRQRVAIARVVLQNPRLLILDEATSALDFATERQVCRNLAQAFRGRTVFFVTHRLRAVQGADLILCLDGGVIAERGTHAELLALGGLYAVLHGQQDLVA